MLDKMKNMIDQLDEKELKSALFLFYCRVQAVEEGNGYSEQHFFSDIKKSYNDLLESGKNNANDDRNAQYEATHIVFGYSPMGSLRWALKELELNQKEKIITFADLFSIGPTWQLHDVQGMDHRYEWLRTHINIDDEVLSNYPINFERAILNIDQIPTHHPIIIWAGENAHEQTGLRYVLHLLKGKANDIIIINTNKAYQTYFDRPEIDFTPRSTGELSPEQLKHIYENEKNRNILTQMERKTLEQQWDQLCKEKEVLRIWQDHKIMSVPETFYDEYIIQTVKKSHSERKNNDFIKSARIIGGVIGHLDQYVGDGFIEYRVRRLIVDGIFDMEGIPKAMRYYSIKMR